MTVVPVVVLLCVYYDWWPLSGNMEYLHKLLIAAPALLVLAGAALEWIFCTFLYVKRVRRWSWSIAAAPGVVIAAALIGFVFPRPSFDDARPQFEQVAQDIIDRPGSTRSNFGIDGIDIASVGRRGDGGVYFVDADNSVASKTGWIYSPERKPDDNGRVFIVLTDIGGGWYEFEYGT
jgi:hypothetical protein